MRMVFCIVVWNNCKGSGAFVADVHHGISHSRVLYS